MKIKDNMDMDVDYTRSKVIRIPGVVDIVCYGECDVGEVKGRLFRRGINVLECEAESIGPEKKFDFGSGRTGSRGVEESRPRARQRRVPLSREPIRE